MNVAGAIVRREIARSRGATAVAKGTALDTLHLTRGIDSIETPHPGGEIKTHNRDPLDLFCETVYFFSVDFLTEGHLNELYIAKFPFEGFVALLCFLQRCCFCFTTRVL